MGYKILFVEEAEKITTFLENLRFYDKDKNEIDISLSDLEMIVIDNYKTNISVNLLNKILEYKITLVFCDKRHTPNGFLSGFNFHVNSFSKFTEQLNWKDERKIELWTKIVKNKIKNQNKILKNNNKNEDAINLLNKFYDEVLKNDQTNREGLAARTYFKVLFGKNFIRFNDDGINSALNYGYQILRSQIVKIIVSKGYLPILGIHHIGINNYFNLADDLIEPLRPIIDDWVYKNIKITDVLTTAEKEKILKLLLEDYTYNNKKQTFFNFIKDYISNCLSFLAEETEYKEYEL